MNVWPKDSMNTYLMLKNLNADVTERVHMLGHVVPSLTPGQ